METRDPLAWRRGQPWQLLEREQPLAAIAEAAEQAAAGRGGRLLFVTGEAGIGKTALMRQFTATHPECRVLTGICDPLGAAETLGPLFDMAAALAPDVQSRLSSGAPRPELFACVLTALNKPNKGLLVVFEDVQWADEATLDLLRYLGRRIERLAAVIIATYRDEEARAESPLTLALGDLATAPAVQRIELAPLSEHATSRLAERTNTDPAELHRRTGGNPFFITEVLAAGGDRVPATVRDAVLARIARLAGPTRLAIEAAAAVGPRLDTELLEYVLDASAIPRWSIRAALFTGILREDAGGLAFRHALAQSAIIESVPPDRLQKLHQLVLEGLLRGTAGPEIYSALVLHAEGAGDDDAVAMYAPLAAARAAAFNAHRESASLYERALSRGRKHSQARRAELIEFRADQLRLGGDHQAALAEYEKASAIWQTENHTRGLSRCLLQTASLQFLAGQHAEAEKAEAEAIAYLEKFPLTRELAQAYEGRARHRFMALNPSEAEDWAIRAHTVAEQLGDMRTALQASVIVAAARLLVGDDGGRLALLSHLDEASNSGDIDLTARSAFYLSWLPMLNGNYEGVEEAFNRGIACADEHELDYWRQLMLAARVRFCLDQCRWRQAEETALAILAGPASSVVAVLPSLTALGRIGARRGESDCLRYLDRAREIAAAHPQLEAVTGSLPARVEAVWLTGDWNRAASEANSALAGAMGNGNPWWTGELMCWLDRSAAEYSQNCNVGAPHALELAGNYKAAAQWWEERGCRYEAALSGSRADDQDALTAAIATFDALGAVPAASWARNRLRGLGIATIPRGPRPSTSANPAHLTQREQEVLELVAGGCTNADISRQLFISPKTVERHLSSILGKLGVTSRSQAVDRAREVGALATPQDAGSQPPN